uniref:Neurotransmitter-gated ion-channel ligand-binding domain-containing protein n=1 Tax=Acrobeloides nanus TaxID=290746 RepID=A0A914DBK4_9BILA
MDAIIETGYWRNDSLGAHVQLMFPAIYKLSCAMHGLRYFPYDEQNCTFIISSWTHDSSTIDYYARDSSVNLKNFQKNQEWDVISFEFQRFAQKYKCCEHPWVMLYAHLVIRRRPLYYIINLVIPTSIITCVAVTGFFTPSSTSTERDEKLYLGINTLM